MMNGTAKKTPPGRGDVLVVYIFAYSTQLNGLLQYKGATQEKLNSVPAAGYIKKFPIQLYHFTLQ